MREQVCIVLNEREPTKAKAAESLIAQLRAANITASRIPVTEQLAQILKQRQAKVVVLDYLLGDYSTGLDILSALQSMDPERRPHSIFLTDEPSIQVAVDALRGGAIHYVELEDPQAISKVAREVEALLKNHQLSPLPDMSLPTMDDLVLGAPAARSLESQMRSAATKRSPIVCVTGKAGSGLSTIAHAVLKLYSPAAYFRTVSLRTFCGNLSSLAGIEPPCPSLRLGNGLSLVIEHAEEEDGSLLKAISAKRGTLWSESAAEHSVLIIVSSDASVSRAWKQQANAEVIAVPGLEDRAQDMAAFVQRFVRKAEEYAGKRLKPFPAETIAWLASREWPGQLRQLESVIVDTALAAVAEGVLQTELEQRMQFWLEASAMNASESVDPLSAAAVLEQYGYCYQTAAARLGCSAKQLRAIIGQRAGERSAP